MATDVVGVPAAKMEDGKWKIATDVVGVPAAKMEDHATQAAWLLQLKLQTSTATKWLPKVGRKKTPMARHRGFCDSCPLRRIDFPQGSGLDLFAASE